MAPISSLATSRHRRFAPFSKRLGNLHRRPSKLTLSQPVVDGHKISASVSGSASGATEPHADLYAALVDPKDTTEVHGGENSGHRLHHVAVVRSLQRVGKLKDLEAGPVSFSLNAPADAKPGQMRVVVFAQESGQGPVLGAASAGITPQGYSDHRNPKPAITI